MQEAVFSIVETFRVLGGQKVGYVGVYRNGKLIDQHMSNSLWPPAARFLLEASIGSSVVRVESLMFRVDHGFKAEETFPDLLAELGDRIIPVRVKSDPSLDNLWASATHQELDDIAKAHKIAGAAHDRNYSMVRFDLSEADPCGRWLLAKRLNGT